MATYTMPLRNIIEQATQYEEGLSHAERIEAGRKKLFDFRYDFYDEEYRSVFETNFIRKFYFTEIGFETEGQFKFQLETWLRLNMHYYNRLFESELFDYDPLVNYDVQTTYNRENTLNQGDETTRSEDNETNQDHTGTSNEDQISKDTVGVVGNVKENTNENTNGTTTDNNKTIEIIESNENTSEDSKGTNTSTNRSDSETDENESSEQSVSRETTTTDNEFNRDLKSDTPNERLSITANDNGTGVINYASEINENKRILNGNQNENTNTSNEGNKNTKTNVSGSENQNSTGELDRQTIGNSARDLESDSNTTNNQDSTGELNRNSKEDTERNSTGNINGRTTNNQKSNSNTNESSSLNRNVNNVEDFIERRYGSAGVKTYPELIEGYRNSLLRIEVMMFEEMRPKLFMGLY